MNRGGEDLLYDVPPTRGSAGKGMTGSGKRGCCGSTWQLDGIFWVCLIVGLAIIGLIIGVVSKSDDLDQTSRATVMMRNDTVELRKNVEAYIQSIRANFPANQETVTMEQVLDSVDKAHAMMVWLNELRSGLPPDTIQLMVKNANSLVANGASMVGTVKGLFDELGATDKERHRAMMGNAALFFAKSAELLATVSPGEFHAAFASGHEAVQTMARLSQNISHDRVNRIIESASDILGAADSAHVVTVIADLVKGATEIVHRFAQPGGLRISLPVGEGAR